MDYTKLLNELKDASLFDLYRLYVAIGNELDSPNRILAIKAKLRIGMEMSYFYYAENRSIKVNVLELRQKNAVVFDCERQKSFVIPYYMLNIDNTETTIHENTKILTVNNLKIGDIVGFNKDGKDIIGTIKKMNYKTVSLVTNFGAKWRVAYCYLYRVHDAKITQEALPNQM